MKSMWYASYYLIWVSIVILMNTFTCITLHFCLNSQSLAVFVHFFQLHLHDSYTLEDIRPLYSPGCVFACCIVNACVYLCWYRERECRSWMVVLFAMLDSVTLRHNLWAGDVFSSCVTHRPVNPELTTLGLGKFQNLRMIRKAISRLQS